MNKACYLSLGSNKGKREHFLRDALKALESHPAITVTQVSRVYETQAWGKTDQPDFLNQVVAFETSLTPERLLMLCESIEKTLGRLPAEKWGPREIDVDILLMGDTVMNHADLQLPHPHMHERRFVLVPLLEIAPRLCDPIHGRPYADALTQLPADPKVIPL